MRNKNMKIYSVFTLMTVLIGSYAVAEPQTFIQEQIRVNTYFRNLVQSKVESIVPKGNYTVDVNMQLDQQALKKYYDGREITLDLPLSGTFMNSGSQSIEQAGPQSASVDELLKFVSKKIVRIGVSESVSPVIRNLVKESVQSELQFSAEKGEVVETFDLPKEFADSWIQWLQQGQQNSGAFKSVWIALAGVLGFCALMGVFFLVGIRALSTRVLSEINSIAQKRSEDKAPDFNFAKEMNAAQTQKGSSVSSDPVNENRVFEKLDLQTLKILSSDCISNQKYQYVPYGLIFNWLDRAMSDEMDKALPDAHKPFPAPGEAMLSKSEVAQYLGDTFPQYRVLTKSEFAMYLAQYTSDQIAYFADTLAVEDAVVMLDKLSPLKKKACLNMIPLSKRLELSKISLTQMGTAQIDAKEKVLKKGIELFANSPQAKTYSLKQASKKVLQADFLEVASFADDENLYEITKNDPSLYHGVLKVCDEAGAEFWSKADVKEISMLTFGYSEQVRSKVEAKFSDKRREWYKSFCEKFAASGMAYDHAMIQSLRSQLLEKYSSQSVTESNQSNGKNDQKAA